MSFAERRAVLERRLAVTGGSQLLSLARYRLHQSVAAAIEEHARGNALDVGAGFAPYRGLLEARADRVTVVDVEDRGSRPDFIADIQHMPEVPDGVFDTVLCTQVLEHVPHPSRAMSELSRVLAPGGRLILSVPHLSVIHEAPHDYFRFTRFALERLGTDGGLEPVEIEPAGGLFAFVGHGVSVALLTMLGTLPGLFHPARLVNTALLIHLAGFLDDLAGMHERYACNYVAVFAKGQGP